MLIFIFVSGYIDYFFNPLFSFILHFPAFPVALAKAAGPFDHHFDFLSLSIIIQMKETESSMKINMNP